MPHDSVIGQSIYDLDTPVLVLDLDACDRNLGRMVSYFADRPAKLRPHYKNHKCTRLAHRQLAAGAAVGVTCAQINEAESLAAAGVEDILIANQVVGRGKVKRLMDVAERCNLAVAVDDCVQADAISCAARERGVIVGLLLEVDIGMGRCGVPPGPSCLELAKRLVDLPATQFRGLQAYEGHAVYVDDVDDRRRLACTAMQRAQATRSLLQENGIPVRDISGSSSATHRFTGTMEGVTEIQAGTYATMDWRYHQLLPDFEIALSVLATVISSRPGQAVLDVGVKSIGSEFGLPKIKDAPAAEIPFFGAEEHCVVCKTPDWSVGDVVTMYSSHACTTCNLHPQMFVHQQGRVVDIWRIDGSSRLA